MLKEAELPETASFDYHTMHNSAGSRRYKLYIPAGHHGRTLPLIVMLHGCTQSPDDFAAGTRMNELADEQSFFVAYTEQPKSANANKCWNWFSGRDQCRDSGEPLLNAGLTQQIMRKYPVDNNRVYIAGMSAGAATAAIMGATYPDLYAAVGIHSGLACGAAHDIPSAFAAMRRGAPTTRDLFPNERSVPTIVFHGDSDTTVSPVNGDQVCAQASGAATQSSVSRGKSADGIAFTRKIKYDQGGRAITEQWVLHGIGHAWSGGSSQGSFTEPRGPNASREFVRFFLQHERKAG